MKGVLKKTFASPWFYFVLVGVILVFLPTAYLYVQGRQERVWTNVTAKFGTQFQTSSSIPYAMDFNSSRIVQFQLTSGKGLQALNRLEQGKVILKGMVSAPGFDVKPMDMEEQIVGASNAWSYVILPKRPGKQVLIFSVEFLLSDDASAPQTELFKLWANNITEADVKAEGDLVSYTDRNTIHVAETWLNLENISQVAGLLSTVAGLVLLLLRNRRTEVVDL